MTFIIHLFIVLFVLDARKFIVTGEDYVMGTVNSYKTCSKKFKKVHQTAINELLCTVGVAIVIALISSTVVASVESTTETKKVIKENVDARVELYESAFE